MQKNIMFLILFLISVWLVSDELFNQKKYLSRFSQTVAPGKPEEKDNKLTDVLLSGIKAFAKGVLIP